MGSGAKSYVRKSFLIYEEMRKFFPYMRTLRRLLQSYMTLHPISLNFLIYGENFISFFYQCVTISIQLWLEAVISLG